MLGYGQNTVPGLCNAADQPGTLCIGDKSSTNWAAFQHLLLVWASSGWPQIHTLPVSISGMLGLQTHTHRILFVFIELGERHEEEEAMTFYFRDRADHMCHCCQFYDGCCSHGGFQTLDIISFKSDEFCYFGTQSSDKSAGTNWSLVSGIVRTRVTLPQQRSLAWTQRVLGKHLCPVDWQTSISCYVTDHTHSCSQSWPGVVLCLHLMKVKETRVLVVQSSLSYPNP